MGSGKHFKSVAALSKGAQRGSSKELKSVAALIKGAQSGSSKGLKSGASEAPCICLLLHLGNRLKITKKVDTF